MTPDDETRLDQTFAQLRAQDVPLSEGLMDRIMADADAVLAQSTPQPAPLADPATAQDRPRSGPFARLWAGLLEAIGGWPSFGGLAAATLAGLWIGVAPPQALDSLTDAFWGGAVEVPVLDSDFMIAWEG